MSAVMLTAGSLPLPHGFFTRQGGVSSGPFASLNCSLSSRDDPEAVRKNRARAAAALGLWPDALLGLLQVHGQAVADARTPWADEARPEADAMVTDRPGTALGIVTADCAPVLFADAGAGVIGAAHAGWRGAVAGVLEATLDAMERLGARRGRIAAVVGPCIAQASYEVGPDLRDAVLAGGAGHARFFAPGGREGHWQFDLPGYCLARLEAAGAGQAAALGIDTLAEEARFFSHRRRTLSGGGPIGHQLSAIALPAG
ncbi:peptidoglycan editing factor PgeF [Falsiroseomonas sp. CW058]|uniref:peptidoglycan editing factor PgeF n=1 Tax=Falsiroseomonas sp. CW058 TaxID=3388664 RepID=UPI003D31E509